MLTNKGQTRRIQPGPGARALYLGSREHKRVSCTDEALVVTNARAQVMRYRWPVWRVWSAAPTWWTGAAQHWRCACARASASPGLTAEVRQLAASTRKSATPRGLSTVLELWSERFDGVQLYQNWLRARRMDIVVRWGEAQNPSITPQQWEAAEREYVYGGKFTVHLPTALRDLSLAYVAAQLNSHGWCPALGTEAGNTSIWTKTCASCYGPR